jgi:hypothetical protein
MSSYEQESAPKHPDTATLQDNTAPTDDEAKHQPPKLSTAVTDIHPDEPAELQSPTRAADAKRAMSAAAAWKPAMDRRPSWDKQDYKRAMQMTGIEDVQSGPGFSERKN